LDTAPDELAAALVFIASTSQCVLYLNYHIWDAYPQDREYVYIPIRKLPMRSARICRAHRCALQSCHRLTNAQAKNPSQTPPGHQYFGRRQKGRRLLRGDLPRRIERAGIVDFSDLMVGEAENLPKNFVSMFAEQR
jgi:hypothetical protein